MSVEGALTTGTDSASASIEINNDTKATWITGPHESNLFGGITLVGSKTINASGSYPVEAILNINNYTGPSGGSSAPITDIYAIIIASRTES